MNGAGSIVQLGASDYALRILETILERFDVRVLALVDSDIDDRRAEIAARFSGRVSADRILDVSALKDPAFIGRLDRERPDLVVSAHFGHILDDAFIAVPRHGVVNVHSALLPHNRGNWPEVWSIVRGTPAGMTLHFIDRGIDTGDIVAQREVEVAADDTCETLAAKIEVVGLDLVRENFADLVSGKAKRKPQGSKLPLNLSRHLHDIEQIDLDRTYTGRELLDRLRALTIPRLLPGAFFIDPKTGERVHVRVEFSRSNGARPDEH